MLNNFTNDSLADVYIFETNKLIELFEQIVLTREKTDLYTKDNINEIFRIMHTIKGSSAMMGYDQITALTHTMEDLFSFIRDEHPAYFDRSELTDLILAGTDFIKEETNEIKEGGKITGDPAKLIEENKRFLHCLKVFNDQIDTQVDGNKEFKEVITFEEKSGTTNKQSMIRINGCKLDKLMDLMGELVVSQSVVTQYPDIAELKSKKFDKAVQRLELITKEMQDVVMSLRMIPLSVTFTKMHRIVRDMGKKLNKDVLLKVIGEEIEMDQNIIEYISISLMHLISNAVVHGLELPEERIKKGKPKTGTVTLEANISGMDVLISVTDDGHGLDKEKILKKAAKMNLLYKEATDMTDQEIYNLIFLPGFSTNESVTEYSGRGVGMDAVVKSIEAIQGTVSVDSSAEKGTVFTIKIPGRWDVYGKP